ncbi:MAG: transporter [Gammaproteobacteria bacterium BRH_c0]|nr:MAG: transporter [Gammaproteobacteria bacterium BRH_c0]
MHKLKTLALATATASLIVLSPLAAHAEDGDLGRQLSEARQEGSVWTALAINRHLNPFKIDVDVESGTATLSGTVETDIDRDLAEQVALGIDGVEKVDNRLKVDADVERRTSGEPTLSSRFSDATLTATVKSKLLWNRHTEGLDINVTTQNGVVTLEGEASNSAASELAERLAEDTDGVRDVRNKLRVSATDTTAANAQDALDDAGEAISDAWITSKVKSSFLLSSNLDGLDIKVETRDGKVTLTGTVQSSAEKALAVETAENLRGVKDVNADGLRVAG